jgi:hypothetical protein
MWPMVVVVVQPSREGVKALLVGGVGANIGPFALQGQLQPLDLAVGLGPVGSDALVGHPGTSQDLAEASRAVAVPLSVKTRSTVTPSSAWKASARRANPATVLARSSGWTSR